MVSSRSLAVVLAFLAAVRGIPAQTGFAESLTTITLPFLPVWEAGDLNGDSRWDLAAWPAPPGAGTGFVALSGPAGHTIITNPYPVVAAATSLRIADVDGDGRDDILLVSGGVLVCLRGTPAGPPAAPIVSPLPGATGPGKIDAVADFTGDGAPDVVVTAGVLLTAIGNGAGWFLSIASAPLTTWGIRRAEPIDWDADGDLDLIASDAVPALMPWWNNGAGTFAPGPHLPVPAEDFDLADVDDDGDRDIVYAPGPWIQAYAGIVWNLGAGATAVGPLTWINDLGHGVPKLRAADLDGDGRDDLVFLRAWQNTLGLPSASFALLHAYGNPSGLLPPGAVLAQNLAYPTPDGIRVLDADADGDRDIVLAGSSLPVRILRNLRLGPHGGASGPYFGGCAVTGGASGVPRPRLSVAGTLAPGSVATLTVSGGPAGAPAWLLLGPAPAQFLSPFGCVLAVAPAGLFAVPHVLNAAGAGSVAIAIPATLPIPGMRAHLQDVFPSGSVAGGADGTNGLMAVLP